MKPPNPPVQAPHSLGRLVPNPKSKLADQCREVMRFRHLARRTEETYLGWIERYVKWLGNAEPGEATPHPRSLSMNREVTQASRLLVGMAVAC